MLLNEINPAYINKISSSHHTGHRLAFSLYVTYWLSYTYFHTVWSRDSPIQLFKFWYRFLGFGTSRYRWWANLQSTMWFYLLYLLTFFYLPLVKRFVTLSWEKCYTNKDFLTNINLKFSNLKYKDETENFVYTTSGFLTFKPKWKKNINPFTVCKRLLLSSHFDCKSTAEYNGLSSHARS